MITGDKGGEDSREIIYKFLVDATLTMSGNFFKNHSNNFLISVGNQKSLDISFVIAFQKGLHLSSIPVDTCDITAVVETTSFSLWCSDSTKQLQMLHANDDEENANWKTQSGAKRCIFSLNVIFLNIFVNFSLKYLRWLEATLMGWWQEHYE